MTRLGVVGTMVWDTIYGRDPVGPPIEEWGGIAYALSAFAARVPHSWEIVPLIKVGRDLAEEANKFLRSLPGVARGARFAEVPQANNRVVLRYRSLERRSEQLSGGVPAWTWPELGPMVADLDALYVNFVAGFEFDLETAQALRRGLAGPIYADLHSLFLGVEPDGTRTLQPLPAATQWFKCFNIVQINEDEMLQITGDPLALAAQVLDEQTRLLVVTLGARGAVYVDRPPVGGPLRTARIPAPNAAAGDPTGCGDVFGATLFCDLLQEKPTELAIAEANRLAARNVRYRGATGLDRYLRGELAST